MSNMNLRLVLELDDRGAIKGIRDADGKLIRLGRDGGRAGAEIAGGMSKARRGIASISEQLGAMHRQIMGLIGIGFGAQMVRDVLRIADAYKEASARLIVAGRSAADAAAAYRELKSITRETRADFTATLDLYARLARSTKELGVSQSDLLLVTKAINQAIVVSGAAAQEAEAAIIQLGQGLASGALRGDELRSVLEQMPRLAEMIASGMGVSLGQLRTLGEQGALTTQAVIAAIRSQAGAVQQEFDRMPVTVSQALTQIRNSFAVWLGELDKASGTTSTLAEGLMLVADNMDIAVRATIGMSAALLALQANTKLAARGFAGLGRAASIVGMAFSGWQIGTALANRFAIARQAGAAFVAGTLKGIEYLKFGWRAFASAIEIKWGEVIAGMKHAFGAFLAGVAGALKHVPFAEGAAAQVQAFADRLLQAQKPVETLAARLRRLRDERDQALAGIDRIGFSMFQDAGRQPKAPPALPKPAEGVSIADPISELRKKQQQKEREELRKHLAAKLAMLETSLMTQSERENQAWENRRAMLAQAREMGLIDDLRYKELEAKLAEQHQQRLTEIQQQAEQERLQLLFDNRNQALSLQQTFGQLFSDAGRVNLQQMTEQMRTFVQSSHALWAQGWRGKLQVASGALSMMSSLMASHSRKQFELGKAAAIANAVVSTAQGAAKALEWGFPMGPIFAGIIAAAGAAQIAAIARTKFGQASGSAGIPAAGVGGGAPSVHVNPASGIPMSATAASKPPQAQAAQPPTINVSIHALHPEQLSPELLQRIADAFAPALQDTMARGGQYVQVAV